MAFIEKAKSPDFQPAITRRSPGFSPGSIAPPALLFCILAIALAVRVSFAVYKPPILLNVLVAQQKALVEKTGISSKTIEDLKNNRLLQSDAQIYHLLARNMVAGHGYSDSKSEPYGATRIRTPGYPSFIALVYLIFGPDHRTILFVQSALGALTAFLVYLLGRRLFDTRAGLTAAFVVALYPALIHYDTRILREGFTSTVLTLTVLLSVYAFNTRRKNRRLVTAGALLVLLSMCRPELILLFAPVVYLLARPLSHIRTLWRPALLVALPILLVWVPWTIRNYVTFGSLSPITVGLGGTLWFGNRWADIGGEDRAREDYVQLHEKTKQIMRDNITADNEANVERTFMQMVLNDIAQKPGWFIGMIFKKMALFWKDANGTKKTLPAIHPRLADIVNAYYYLLLALAATGVALGWRKREWVLPLLSVIATYMMIYALLHVRNRYRVPVLPLVFVLSAGGFWSFYDLIRASVLKKSPAGNNGTSRFFHQSQGNLFSPPRFGERRNAIQGSIRRSVGSGEGS